MISLGPHPIIHVSDNGEEQEIFVTINALGPLTPEPDDDTDFEFEAGEVIIEFEDGIRRLQIVARNTLALAGVGIMIAESYIHGVCLTQGGSVYNLLPGDVKKPGDMFK